MSQYSRPPRILFGFHPDWQSGCEQSARDAGFHAEMRPLSPLNLDEFDAFVPLTLDDQAFVDNVNALGGNVRALTVPAEQREICHDKLGFSQVMTAHGFGAHIPNAPKVDNITPNDFPIVVKQRWGSFGHGIEVVHTIAELEEHMPALLNGTAFIQECISGSEEYAAHLLIHDGKLAYSSVIHYQMAAADIVRGHKHKPIQSNWATESPFNSLWEEILLQIGIRSGTVCINYRLREGVPMIFEINPRVGGSLTGMMSGYLRVYIDLINRIFPAP